uniref:Uncharacterized protein n=1 Tax=Populus trichocarpa TaxID=3694 RepID=A9P8Y6_POPTR|nr:unknown [Populus trichocarpa]
MSMRPKLVKRVVLLRPRIAGCLISWGRKKKRSLKRR